MSRYRMNTRPIFGENEPTWAESANKGIGSAIELYLRNKKATEDWENDVRMKGGTVDPVESMGDRVRRIGTQVKRKVFGDPGASQRAEGNLDANRGVLTPQVTAHDIPREGDFDAPVPGGVVPIRGPRNPAMDTNATGRDGLTRSPIAEAIERSIVKGPGGRTGTVPTSFGDFQRRQAVTQQGALERVAARPQTGQTHEQRVELEGMKHQNRLSLTRQQEALRLKRAVATRKGDTAELRRLDLAERNLQLRAEGLGISIDRTLATAGEPDAFERMTAESDDARMADITAGDRSRAAARRRLETKRGEITGKKTYSTNPQIAAAQRMWDANSNIQRARPRPK